MVKRKPRERTEEELEQLRIINNIIFLLDLTYAIFNTGFEALHDFAFNESCSDMSQWSKFVKLQIK